MELDEHFKFAGFLKDFACFQGALPLKLIFSAEQMFSLYFNTAMFEEAVEATKVSARVTAALASRIGVNSCSVPPGIGPV